MSGGRLFDTATPPHIATLVMATAVGAVAINVFLPSLPGIARHFGAEYAVAQLLLSSYLAATATLQLFIGPASDRYGRRPVMLICLSIFLLATLAAIFAPSIEALIGLRVLQAFAAAGMVLSRAVVRDTVGPDEAASRLGYIATGMTLAPMIGPAIGGLLEEQFGWQSTFVLTFVLGAIATIFVFLDLGETNKSRSNSMVAQFRAYPSLLVSRRFWGYSLAAAFTSGAFFAFLGGGPYVATEQLGASPSQYGLYFALLSLGYMGGNFLSGRYSRRLGINLMMLSGNVVAVTGVLISIALFLVGFDHPLSLFGPALLIGVGNGISIPNANAGIVSVRPNLAGSASGLGGALQIGGGAALSVVAGAWLTATSGPYPLLAVMLASAVAAVFASAYVIRVERIAGPLGG